MDLENQWRERRVVAQAHATSATHDHNGYHNQHHQQNQDQYRHGKVANVRVRGQDILTNGRGRIKTPSSVRVMPSSRYSLVAIGVAAWLISWPAALRMLRVSPSADAAPNAAIEIRFDRPIAGRSTVPWTLHVSCARTPGSLEWLKGAIR